MSSQKKSSIILFWVAFLLCGYSAIISFFHFVSNPLPFPDWGNAGLVFSDEASRQTYIDVLRMSGLEPDFRVDTTEVSRAIYSSRLHFILNVPSKEISAKVGEPNCFIAVTVNDPDQAAKNAALVLRSRGHSAEVASDPDPELPKNALAILVSDAFPNKAIVYRKHVTQMGDQPPKWRDK